MKNKIKKLSFPFLIFVIGVFWSIYGFNNYEWMKSGRPGTGFFPIITGIALGISAFLCLFIDRDLKIEVYRLNLILPVILTIIIIIFSEILGFILSIFLGLFFWSKFYNKYSVIYSLIFSLSIVIIIYLTFSLWLKIPFPLGIFKKYL